MDWLEQPKQAAAFRMVSDLLNESFQESLEMLFDDIGRVDLIALLLRSPFPIGDLAFDTDDLLHRIYVVHAKRLIDERSQVVESLAERLWHKLERYDCLTKVDVREHTSLACRRALAHRILELLLPACEKAGIPVEGNPKVPFTLADTIRGIALSLQAECWPYSEEEKLLLKYDGLDKETMQALGEITTTVYTRCKIPVHIELSFDARKDWRAYYDEEEGTREERFEEVLGLWCKACAPCSRRRLSAFLTELVARMQTLNALFDPLPGMPRGTIKNEYLSTRTPARAVWKTAIELLFPIARKNDLGSAIQGQVDKMASPEWRTDIYYCAAAIEAIVSQGRSTTDAVARRSAVLLRSERHETPRWSDFFKRLYDRRSALAHGRSPSSARDDEYLFWRWMKDIYRAVFHRIQHYVATLGEGSELPSRDEFLKAIDDEIAADPWIPFEADDALRKAARIDVI